MTLRVIGGGKLESGLWGGSDYMSNLRYSEMPAAEMVSTLNRRGIVAYEGCTVVVEADTGAVVVILQGDHLGVEAFATLKPDNGVEFILVDPVDGRVH